MKTLSLDLRSTAVNAMKLKAAAHKSSAVRIRKKANDCNHENNYDPNTNRQDRERTNGNEAKMNRENRLTCKYTLSTLGTTPVSLICQLSFSEFAVVLIF